MSETIRVFVGSEPKTEIYRHVLQHSIIRRTKAAVEFTPMIGHGWEYSLDGIKVGTGFSLRRWRIAEACGWKGRAIYCDADMVAFADIAQLWRAPDSFPAPAGTSAWLTYQPDKFSKAPWPQTALMVIDCAAAKSQWGWDFVSILRHLKAYPTKDAYAAFMHMTWASPPPARIPAEWNDLNRCVPGSTKIWHDTSESKQVPYTPGRNPLTKFWEAEAVAAIQSGYLPRQLIEEGLSKWGKKEDWRFMNGLHPYWKKLLGLYGV